MANTYVDYTGNGSETDFNFSFPYIKTSHVVVEVNEGQGAGGLNKWVRKTLTTDYSVQTSPTTFVRFVTPPGNNVRVRVLRDSDASTGLVDFANGSVLTETELDNSYEHNRYLAEEAEEGITGGALVKNTGGQFDADGLRLENLAAPDSDDDAVNKGYADNRYVDVAGDTMTGNLVMGDGVTNNKITNLASPDAASDAANKNYVDDSITASFVTGSPPPGNQIGTALIEDGAVTADKISSTSTIFNVGTTVGIGAQSGNNYELEVLRQESGTGIALFTDDETNSLVKVENRTPNALATGTTSEIKLDAHAGGTKNSSVNIGVFDSTLTTPGEEGYAHVTFNNEDQCSFRFNNTDDGSNGGSFFPGVDSAQDLGGSAKKWDEVYAANGTINTSDVNEKQDIAELDEAERRVATAAKGLVKKFRWIKDVQAKGDTARIHVGIMAQELEAAFTAEGLDASRYSMFCKDDYEEEVNGVVTQKTRYSVRYTELLAFIISAL